MKILTFLLNPILGLFGKQLRKYYIGHWSVREGKPRRSHVEVGWRIMDRSEYAGLPDDATELDRFLVSRIRQHAKAKALKAPEVE